MYLAIELSKKKKGIHRSQEQLRTKYIYNLQSIIMFILFKTPHLHTTP